jgi:hypothetical protein
MKRTINQHTMACDAVDIDGTIALIDLPIYSSLCKKCQLLVTNKQKGN